MGSNEDNSQRAAEAERGTERRFPIVGIGASAGGIEALDGLLPELDPSVHAALVIVLHLDPARPSMATQVFARASRLPVEEVVDGVVVTPGHIYVIPPNVSLTFEGRRLRLKGPLQPRHASIDAFLISLAEQHGEAAVGVILSGAGSDGAVGLRAVKAHGGVTVVQQPEEARTDSMPRSAIALGGVDWVLRARDIPARITTYAGTLDAVPPLDAATPSEDVASALRVILPLVLRKTGHDFSQYKQATLLRRVQRRMRVVLAGSVAAYVEVLRDTPAEIDRLFADLLISVTQFFREPEVFAALGAELLPARLHGRGADAPVRVWVAGCATGEEAYSLAIILCEAQVPGEILLPVKIFATDIDEAALDVARQGRYAASIADQVSPERLARFFRKVEGGYRVVKEVRDMCVFSTHNLVSDPPFSRLDLLSCRNLLIYLDGDIQKKLVPLFHYALAPGGCLVLGPSESLAAYPELFRVIDKDKRIFQRLEALVEPATMFPILGQRRAGRLESFDHTLAAPRAVLGEQAITRSFERVLLEEFAPPAVMVNEDGKIVYVSGRTGRYLNLPSGMTRTNVVDMALPALRAGLHTALHRAIKTGQPAAQQDLSVEADGLVRRVDVLVRPMTATGSESRLFIIIFREPAPPVPAPTADEVPERDRALAADLERELRSTREHLQTTIEELEASNEELQSANEELQTSKEEQQSINEELQTVNVELVRKVEELDRANGDLKNLFASTQIATLFLDGELRIKRFSPAATELFRVIDTDVGRPITDIAQTFADDRLVREVREVLATLAPRDGEVHRAEGDRWYIRRVRPYRSVENVIDGVVITLVDITDLKRAQSRLAALAAIVESSQDAIIGLGLDGLITSWNAGAERIYGHAAREAVGAPFAILYPPEGRDALEAQRRRAARGEHLEMADVAGVRKDGQVVDVLLTLSPVRDGDGVVVALAAIAHDVTERRAAEVALRRSEERFRQLSESGVISIAFVDRAGRISQANEAFLALTGHARADLAGGALGFEKLAAPDCADCLRGLLDEVWTAGRAVAQEVDCVRRDGGHFVCLIGGACLDDGAEAVIFLLDITERRRAEDDLRQSEERLRLAIEATRLGTWELDPRTGAITCSPRARALWGLPPEGDVTYEMRLARVHPDDRRAVDEATTRALDPAGAGEYQLSYRAIDPGEQARWIDAWGRTFFSEVGGLRRPMRLIGALLDVTEHRRTEDALKMADRRKDRFLAVLGHELRNPLAPIRNAVQVMRAIGAPDPALVRVRDIIDRQVRHMTHMLDDLLDVGRLASGKVILRKEPMDLVDLVSTAVDEQRADAEQSGVTLTLSLPERPLWTIADPTRLEQSVANLLINAVKFTPSGGHITVVVTPEPGGGAATVSVTDDGMGIDGEMLAHLFEPFSQADRSLDRSRGGLGLGLSLVKSLVELHGGTVAVHSDGAGKGACFTLRVPLEPVAPPLPPPPSAPPRPRRIVVVEDNLDSAESVAMMLELSGHEVAVAHTGAAGVAQVRAFQPDVVLCDIGLPGELDGYAVARALRADPSTASARLIALTGYGQEDDKLRAREAGFEAHLTKPVDPETLDRILAAP